ncbi:MAG: ABC transporter permease [Thermoplasmata archaeon]
MSAVIRGFKNVLAKKLRTTGVVMIVGFSLAVFLTMTIVNANISQNVRNVSQNLEKTVTIRPAGSFGGFGSTTAMNESVVPIIQSAEHVVAVQKIIQHNLVNNTGGDQGGFPSGFGGPPESGGPRVFNSRQMPTILEGLDPTQELVLFGGGTVTITSGRTMNSFDSQSNVAIVGASYTKEDGTSVNLNDIISINQTDVTVTVIGIYTTGTRFGDRSILMPYETVKKILNVSGPNIIYATVDYAGNIDSVVSALNATLGADYDVVSASSQGASLQNSITQIANNSQIGSYAALMTGGAILFFIMAVITRERIREIGVLKAIGFKNSKIIAQFLTESITLATFGFIVGVVVALVGGGTISEILLGQSTTSGSSGGFVVSRGGESGGMPSGGRQFGGGFLANINYSLTPEILIYAFLAAVLLGVLGALYPIMKAMKLKPAEALRYE